MSNPQQSPEIDSIVETMFGMAHSWLGMAEGVTRA